MRGDMDGRRPASIALIAIVISLLVAVGESPPAQAGTISASCPGPPSLQSVIDGAAPGDTIMIGPGTCVENLTIIKDLTLIGSGAGSTILDGGLAGTTVTIAPGANVELVGVTIRGGSGVEGGGVWNQGVLGITDSAVVGNQATERGAGIHNDGGALTLISSLVEGNVAQISGGGIHSVGVGNSVTAANSVFRDNRGVQEHGGALYLSNTTSSLAAVTISENHAGNDGGAVYAVGTGVAAFTNVTVSGNRAADQGGGVFLREQSLTLSHVTVHANDANRGGGFWLAGGITTLTATIVSGNTASSAIAPNPDCAGFGAFTVVSAGFNLFGPTAAADCSFAAATNDLVGVDPMLGPLVDSGGPPTHALLFGSPAIDAVVSGCPPPVTDARGVVRPQGLACDIGAFEAELSTVSTVGLVDPTTMRWRLLDPSGNETTFFFGVPGDVPIVGDWDCDGVDTPGAYRQSNGFVYLRNSNTTGPGEIRFFLGVPGDIPLAGDFDGDGCDTVSVYRPSRGRVFITDELGANDGFFVAEFDYYFGIPGDKPFVGDFDGDGVDTVGLHRESSGFVYFLNRHELAVADSEFFFGIPRDRLMAADWTGDGIDTVAVYRPDDRTFYFRFTNTLGFADDTLLFGESDWLPVAGEFGL